MFYILTDINYYITEKWLVVKYNLIYYINIY